MVTQISDARVVVSQVQNEQLDFLNSEFKEQ